MTERKTRENNDNPYDFSPSLPLSLTPTPVTPCSREASRFPQSRTACRFVGSYSCRPHFLFRHPFLGWQGNDPRLHCPLFPNCPWPCRPPSPIIGLESSRIRIARFLLSIHPIPLTTSFSILIPSPRAIPSTRFVKPCPCCGFDSFYPSSSPSPSAPLSRPLIFLCHHSRGTGVRLKSFCSYTRLHFGPLRQTWELAPLLLNNTKRPKHTIDTFEKQAFSLQS